MGNIFFISDLHFGHENCLAFDARPFATIDEHDTELIRRWNDAVGMDDEVYVLGDISWYNATKTVEIFSKLNGTKHLIRGNHDARILKNKDVQSLFCEITDYKELRLDNKFGIVMCHYPIPCFNNHYYGWVHLYGHVHTGFEYNMMERVKYEMKALYDKECRMYNVGAMLPYMDYTPRSLEEIMGVTSPFSSMVMS